MGECENVVEESLTDWDALNPPSSLLLLEGPLSRERCTNETGREKDREPAQAQLLQ